MNWCLDVAARYAQLIDDYEKGENFGGSSLGDGNVIALSNLYLVASCCYYEHDRSIMTDSLFDRLCKELALRYEELMFSGAWFLELFDEEALAAGSGYHLTGKYPLPVQQIADVFFQRAGGAGRMERR